MEQGTLNDNLNCRHGSGIMKWADGTIYEGEWKLDKRYYGQLKMTNGYIHEGKWFNGLFHGQGKLILKNGITLECNFEAGLTPCRGKIAYKDGSIYNGSLV